MCELDLERNMPDPFTCRKKELEVFRASEIMKTPVIQVTQDASVDRAVELMLQHNLSGVPVVDREGRLVGIFSETDQFDCNYSNRSNTSVSGVMTTDVTSLDVNDSIVDVAKAFKTTPVHRMPVTRDGKVVGVIGCRDLSQFVRELEEQVQALAEPVAMLEDSALWCNND